jgi:hypothetical protein
MIYAATIIEYNGEQEYSQRIFVDADSFKQANEMVDEIISKYYSDCKYNGSDKRWELENGSIQWEVTSVAKDIFQFIFTKNGGGYYSRLKFEKFGQED